MYRVIARNHITRSDFITEHLTLKEAEVFVKEQIYRRLWGMPERWLDEDNVLPKERSRVISERVIANGVKQLFVPADYTYSIEEIKQSDVDVDYWASLRNKRDLYLKNTDYTQIADSPCTSEEKKKYREYREYLRKLPNNYNKNSISEFYVMTFNQWNQWKYKDIK